jgi:hypothetical protein
LATDRAQILQQKSNPEFLSGDRHDRGRMSVALARLLVEEGQEFAGRHLDQVTLVDDA